MQDHGVAENDRALKASELQCEANLEMLFQFW